MNWKIDNFQSGFCRIKTSDVLATEYHVISRAMCLNVASVGRAPTSATQPLMQLYLQPTDLRQPDLSYSGPQTVAEDASIWSVGPQRNINLPLTTL